MEFVDGMFIPTSISHTIHYYLLSGANEKDLVSIMDREKVFFFIKYMLEKHLGKILSLKFTLSIVGGSIIIKLIQIRTDTHVYDVDGRIVINPYNSSINLAITVKNIYPDKVHTKRYLEEGVYSLNSGNIELKYYI